MNPKVKPRELAGAALFMIAISAALLLITQPPLEQAALLLGVAAIVGVIGELALASVDF